MRRFAILAALLAECAAAASAAAGPTQQGVTWLKMEQARAMSQRTGNPMMVYIACDPSSGMGSCEKSPSDRSFSDPALAKRLEGFHCVRVSEKRAAQELKATKCPEVIFLDSDMEEFSRSNFQDLRTLDKALEQANGKYAPREISWASYDSKRPAAPDESKRLTLLAFADDRKESTEELKAMEDRTIAKFHDRFHFVRAIYRRESEEAKKYAVSQAPSFVILEPSKGEVVEKVQGKKTAREIRAYLVKALARPDKK